MRRLSTRHGVVHSLRARLLLALIVIGTLPLAVVGLGGAVLQRQMIAEQSGRELTGLARGLAGQLDSTFEGLLADCAAIASLPDMGSMDATRQGVLLRDLFHEYPDFSRLVVFDPQGRPVASARPGAVTAGTPAFRTAAQGKQAWVVAQDPMAHRWSLLIYTPIRDDDRRLVGVLGVVVDLESLSSLVARVPVGAGGRAFVLGQDGAVLLHSDPVEVREHRDYSGLNIPTLGRATGPGAARYRVGGEARVAGYAQSSALGWTVVAEQPETVVLAPAEQSWRLALIALALSMLAAVGAAFLVTGRLVRPLAQLAAAVRALGAGDPAAPLPRIERADAEVAVLVEAFAAMREAVAARERALGYQKALLEAQREAVPDGILVVAPDGALVSVTRRFLELWEIADEQPEGSAAGPLFAALAERLADPAGFVARLAELAATPEQAYRTELPLRDGRTLDWYSAPVCGEGGAVLGRIWSCGDVTERIRAEAERADLLAEARKSWDEAEAAERRAAFLAEASTRLAASLEYAETLAGVARLAVPFIADWCMVDLVNDDGSIRRVAVACADPRKEHLAARLRDHFPPDPAAPRGTAEVIRDGRPVLLPAVDERWLDGTAQSAEHRAVLDEIGPRSGVIVPLLARGRTLGAIMLLSAESERVYAEADLAFVEELARRCAVALDNGRLYREAREAIHARDEFLSIASHELRTPVAGIKGHAQVLIKAQARGPLEPERLARALRMMGEAADRLAMLTTDLLDVSRLQSGQFELRPAPLDLAALLEELAEHYAAQLSGRHRLRLDTPGGAVPVRADRQRLEQVLTNLLDNALKYSPEGGEVRLVLREHDGGLLLHVSDQGIGLPSGSLETIFEPFGRAPNAVAQHLPGMGLGLYICRRIMERHGGRLWAESEGEGRGSRFCAWLPRTPAGPDIEAAVAPPAGTTSGAGQL